MSSARRVVGGVLAGMLALAIAPSGVMAQSGTLVGRVMGDDGAPLAGAEVRVSTVDGVVKTAADGSFRITDVPTGLYYFGVRRIGYHPASDLLRFVASDTLDVVLARVVATKKLDTVQVQARADAAWEREMRRYASAIDAARFGNVITEQDIAARRPIWTSDLFQNQAGFFVVGGGGGARVVGSRNRCVPSVFLDGQLAPNVRVNDIPPQFIKLLVAFRGASTVPAQFQDIRADPNCGTIVIFTI